MNYTYNILEDYVKNLLHRIDVYHPHQLEIETIANRLGLVVIYTPFSSMRVGKTISLDSRDENKKQWQSFAHELCHVLWHYGNQITMPMTWEVYQEAKARNFALNLCIPSFMLDEIKLPIYHREAVWMIMETFQVDKDFAEQRLEQYLRNLKAANY